MNISGPLVIIGFKGCGKSLIGKLLAESLGLEFTDTDSLVEKLHFEREGKRLSFREIFKKRGKKYFAALEKEAVEKALAYPSCVVSLGGGSLWQASLDDIAEKATFIHLIVAKDVLYERIEQNGLPAFFDKADPRRFFENLLAEREPVYARFANITIDNTNKTPYETVRDIMRELGERFTR